MIEISNILGKNFGKGSTFTAKRDGVSTQFKTDKIELVDQYSAPAIYAHSLVDYGEQPELAVFTIGFGAKIIL